MNLKLPASWSELTNPQLKHALRTIARRDIDGFDARALLAMRWAGLRPLHDKNLFKCRGLILEISAEEIAELARCLQFLDQQPTHPVRPEHIAGRRACHPFLYDLTFGQYQEAENWFQAYINTKDQTHLDRVFDILYPKKRLIPTMPHKKEYARTAILIWWAGVKTMLATRYPHFFKPAAQSADPIFGPKKTSAKEYAKGVAACLRALTKGDITKEEQVHAMSVHSALSELDALAEENERMEKMSRKNAK